MRWTFLPARAGRALARFRRRIARTEERIARLEPSGERIGRAVVSYVIDPYLAGAAENISHAHTQDWESWTIGRTLADLGFSVEAMHWTNRRFVPAGPRDLLIDARCNLERLAPAVGPACVKIFHAETAHWRVSDEAQLRRLAELEARRGIRLTRTRLVGENHGIETADAGVVLGNEWTLASYRPFGKPLFRVPISNAFSYPSPAGRDFDASRQRFLWFGGVGFVHKGLDLVLEACAGHPGLELAVAAPLDREPDFVAAFAAELYRSPNVRPLGWLDVGSEGFQRIAAQTVGMIFPSCSEGGGGSAVTAMHAGLIPLVTRETSLDVEPSFGVLLPDAGVETIRASALEIATRPAAELEAMAVAGWRRANAVHTRAAFAVNYRRALLDILGRFRPDLAERAATRIALADGSVEP